MNMPVGLGYEFNPNQEKCFGLTAIINSVVVKSGPQQFATTNYKEGKGYFVHFANKNYYPTNKTEWDAAVKYFQQMKITNDGMTQYEKMREDRLANIRSKLSEEEQLVLGCHVEQHNKVSQIYSKLTDDEQAFIDVNFRIGY
jgi:hypothetical protein